MEKEGGLSTLETRKETCIQKSQERKSLSISSISFMQFFRFSVFRLSCHSCRAPENELCKALSSEKLTPPRSKKQTSPISIFPAPHPPPSPPSFVFEGWWWWWCVWCNLLFRYFIPSHSCATALVEVFFLEGKSFVCPRDFVPPFSSSPISHNNFMVRLPLTSTSERKGGELTGGAVEAKECLSSSSSPQCNSYGGGGRSCKRGKRICGLERRKKEDKTKGESRLTN